MNEEQKDLETNKNEVVKKIGIGAKRQFSEFIDFIRRQGIVGFAIAFILGGAISALVASIISNLVNPILGVVLGRAKDMADAYINFFGGKIMYGKLLNDFINFFVLAAVVYFGVKKLGLDKLDKPKV
jgi:large conductance mechanosensitive channel